MSETRTPLSERAGAPATLPEIAHDDVADVRPFSQDDVQAILALEVAIAKHDHPDDMPTEESILDDLRRVDLNPATDTIGLWNRDGEMIALQTVRRSMSDGDEDFANVSIGGGVHPEYRGRGLGTLMIEWALGRARQLLADLNTTQEGRIGAGTSEEKNPDAVRLLTEHGFVPERYWDELVRDLSEPIEDRQPRGGVHLVPMTKDLNEAVRRAKNDSFRDHWGSTETVAEHWEIYRGESSVRDDLSTIALDDDGAVLGFALVNVYPEDFEGRGYTFGYIALIGTTRAARGRGIAPAVITETLRKIKEAGFQKATLEVDSINPSGAYGLYEALGFVAGERYTTFQITV